MTLPPGYGLPPGAPPNWTPPWMAGGGQQAVTAAPRRVPGQQVRPAPQAQMNWMDPKTPGFLDYWGAQSGGLTGPLLQLAQLAAQLGQSQAPFNHGSWNQWGLSNVQPASQAGTGGAPPPIFGPGAAGARSPYKNMTGPR